MTFNMQPALSCDLQADTHDLGFTFDECKQEISSKVGSVHLRSKLWQVLSILTQGSNQLIKRDTLIEQVWQGNFLTGPQGLTHTICHLRRIIKRLELPLSITTVPKQGYILRVNTQQAKAHNPQPRLAANSYFFSTMDKISKSANLVPFALAE